jgi:hypothetical protein
MKMTVIAILQKKHNFLYDIGLRNLYIKIIEFKEI